MKRTNNFFTLALYVVALCFWTSGCRATEAPLRWIIQIEDNCNNEFSTQLVEIIKQKLDGKIYVATKDYEIVLQEIAKSQGKHIDKDFPPHEFISNTDIQLKNGDGKIYMRFNRPNANGLYNADFLLFLYQKDGTWERVLNPGNFRFKKELTEAELQARISELLVKLTFK